MDYPDGPAAFDNMVRRCVWGCQPTYLDDLLNGQFERSPLSLKDMYMLTMKPTSGLKVDRLGAFAPYVQMLGLTNSWKNLFRVKLLDDLAVKLGKNHPSLLALENELNLRD